MAMPFLMAAAEWKYLKTNQQVYRDLSKAWSRGVAIFFATGAVSGTVLSFELGLLWPKFMEHAGAIIGMPFSLEGTAFFIEAIALGLFLYGWDKLNRKVHFISGIVVGISGVISGIFVVSANGWMNAPSGFDWVNGQAINIDPLKAMFNDAWLSQAIHMTLAAFAATSFAVAGIHGFILLKYKDSLLHQKAFKIALLFAAISSVLQPVSGDFSAKDIAKRQPAKLAAMESLFKTSKPAEIIIGGIPDVENEKVNYGIHIPKMLSFLAHGDFESEVIGLDKFPKADRPPVAIVHIAFQIMVACGSLLAAVSAIYLFLLWRKKELIFSRMFLKIAALCTPVGFIAVESGWTVTEVGRQPWIINGIMRTSEALTPMPGLQFPLIVITIIYIILSFVVLWLLSRQIKAVNMKYA